MKAAGPIKHGVGGEVKEFKRGQHVTESDFGDGWKQLVESGAVVEDDVDLKVVHDVLDGSDIIEEDREEPAPKEEKKAR